MTISDILASIDRDIAQLRQARALLLSLIHIFNSSTGLVNHP